MNFNCCANSENISENDSFRLSFHDESLETLNERANILTCDYKDATPLFRAIEQEDWRAVLIFLTTGRWSASPLTSQYEHLHDPPPERQARTWVHFTGREGESQWQQLPLHAAISYLAPLPVVQKLVELYRYGVQSRDDTGNLPLHLAFGFGSPDNVVAYLIKEYPRALSVKGLQNRRPVECCDLGGNKSRWEIIKACQEHTRATMVKEWDRRWKQSLEEAKTKAGLIEPPFALQTKTLEEVFNELVQVKIELRRTKELAKSRPSMIITKTEPFPRPPRSISLGKVPTPSFGSFGKRSFSGSVKKPIALLRAIRSAASTSGSVAPSSSAK
jgi:hypothetical protein